MKVTDRLGRPCLREKLRRWVRWRFRLRRWWCVARRLGHDFERHETAEGGLSICRGCLWCREWGIHVRFHDWLGVVRE